MSSDMSKYFHCFVIRAVKLHYITVSGASIQIVVLIKNYIFWTLNLAKSNYLDFP